MDGRVIVAGVGPGNPEWVTGRVRGLLEKADVLAGFRSAVAVVEPFLHHPSPRGRGVGGEGVEKLVLDYRNQEEGLAKVAALAREGKLCLVCFYGDPNFSDTEFLARIRRHWPNTEVVPGISSAQLACARAGIAMEHSLFITLHVREGYQEALEELMDVVSSSTRKRNVILLPRPWDYMPPAIARLLLEKGARPETRAQVYERLSFEDERAHSLTLEELANSSYQFSDLSVMIIFNPDRGV